MRPLSALIFASCALFLSTQAAVACTATADRTVTICSPLPGSTVASPVQFSSQSMDNEHPMTATTLYVDSQIAAKSTNGTLTASVPLVAGNHFVVIRTWDSSGFYFSTSENITVSSSTAPAPTVSMTANPASITAGSSSTLAVSAQNAASVSVSGSDGSSYTLSSTGGNITVSPAATTSYTATATNSTGQSATSSATVTVTSSGGGGPCASTVDRTVKICAPSANATVPSPVQFTAAALDNEYPITAMILYVDSTNMAKSTGGSLSASVPLANGNHAIVIRAWDSSGFYFSSSETITVSSTTSTAPTVSITATPTNITAGSSSTLTVSAQNASSVTVSGTDGSSYTLASTGGTVSVTPAATTTYTATATNSAAQSATSSATVTVGSSSGGGAASINSVNHVLFLMQENRSFDHYFGMLNPYRRNNGFNVGDDGKIYDIDGIDDKLGSISNQNDEGTTFNLFHTSSSCLDDMTASWLESYGDVYRWAFGTDRPINMDGFVHTAEGFAKSGSGSGSFTDLAGQRAMAYYQDTSVTGTPELNYYYWMASQFALSDRWFSPVSSKSIPNRIATISGGTTQGYVLDPGTDDHAPQLGATTIFQLLDQHGISWKIYYGATDSNGMPETTFTYFSYSGNYIYHNSSGQLVIDSTHIAPMSQYYTDVQNGTLPAFSYIEADYGVNDEHPGSSHSVLTGQAAMANVINALMYSPSWSDSVFFLSYDEAGGAYDHVPPVPGQTNKFTSASVAGAEGDISSIAVNADGYNPCVPTTAGVYSNHCDLRSGMPGTNAGDAPAINGFAAQLGFRVPNLIVSPFARRHYVGHNAMDHTAVIHFLEERFGLPALTKRDAAQPNLLDFFDFSGKPWATPPAKANVPVPPAVGSTCHASSM
jgi:phospholipase C